MATLADAVKKYGSIANMKAANKPQALLPNTSVNNTPNINNPTNFYDPNKIPTNPMGGDITGGMGGATGAGAIIPPRLPASGPTPNKPVVSGNLGTGAVYDPANPEDYLMRMEAQINTTKKAPTQDEYYNILQARKAVDAKSQVNPLTGQAQTAQDALAQGQAAETARDQAVLDPYIANINAQYDIQKADAVAAGERLRSAAQNIYSFSGFGRSSDAANKAVEIQKNTDAGIAQLELARKTDIAIKQAELAGADSAQLKGLRETADSYRKAATDWQVEAIKKTNEANIKSGADYMTAINNMLVTIDKNKINIGNPADVAAWAKIGYDQNTGQINEDVIKALPPEVQSLIRAAAAGVTREAPKTVVDGSGKEAKTYQYNPKTNRFDIAIGGRTYSIGGGGGAQGQPNAEQAELIIRLARIKEAVSNSWLPRSSILLDPNLGADLDYIKSNMTFEKLVAMKEAGVRLTPVSDADMRILGESALTLSYGMTKGRIGEEVDRLINNLGGSQVSTNNSSSKGSTSTNSAPSNTTTTAPADPKRQSYLDSLFK